MQTCRIINIVPHPIDPDSSLLRPLDLSNNLYSGWHSTQQHHDIDYLSLQSSSVYVDQVQNQCSIISRNHRSLRRRQLKEISVQKTLRASIVLTMICNATGLDSHGYIEVKGVKVVKGDPDIAGIGVRKFWNTKTALPCWSLLIRARLWLDLCLGLCDLDTCYDLLLLQLPEYSASNRSCIYQLSDAKRLE